MAAKKKKWAIWIVIALVVIGLAIYILPKLKGSDPIAGFLPTNPGTRFF